MIKGIVWEKVRKSMVYLENRKVVIIFGIEEVKDEIESVNRDF